MTRLTAAALAATIALGLTTASVAGPASGGNEAGNVQVAALERFATRPFANIIAAEAKANSIPIALAHAVVNIESSYRPHVTGAAGEVGLMQIKPATARGMGFRGSAKALYDPATNIKWGMRYLAGAMQRGDGSTCGTILKYNAGHYAKRMNPVSRRYCSKVERELARA
jgi:soluble lytic murein transglycosylase-like protein